MCTYVNISIVVSINLTADFKKKSINIEEKQKCIASTVEVKHITEIFHCFANTCIELFKSAGYDVNDVNTLFHEVCGDVIDDNTVHSAFMSSDDVMSAIKKFKPGKSNGYDGLSSN